jgi:CcmD family protein
MPVYLVVAYAVFWVLTFIFVLSIGIRQRRIEREITMLKAQLDEQGEETA